MTSLDFALQYNGAPHHYDKEYVIPYNVLSIVRGGQRRKVVIQYGRMASGHVMNTGHVIAMSV